MESKTLLCVGGGPKSISAAALAYVLNQRTGADLNVHIIEAAKIGNHWSGSAGFTDGVFPLDTSPFKDIGFPYSSLYGPDVDEGLERLSFFAFLKAEGRFAEWVDRGRLKVSHFEFSRYLSWVAAAIGANITRGRVFGVEPRGDSTAVVFSGDNGHERITGDGVLITGPGHPVRVPVDPGVQGVADARTYWSDRKRIFGLEPGRIAVVGGGQSAGTIVQSILQGSPHGVDVVTGSGMLVAQSSGYSENHSCSTNADAWRALPVEERLAFNERINNGVMDVDLKRALDQESRVIVRRGRVAKVAGVDEAMVLSLGQGMGDLGPYRAVVLALGFNQPSALNDLLRTDVGEVAWEDVDHHLRVRGLNGNVHVPGMAGLSQGPGFPLLSSLGTGAERILSAYTEQSLVPLTEMEYSHE